MPTGLNAVLEPKTIVLVGDSELKKENEVYSRQFNSLLSNLSDFKGKMQIIDLSGKTPESESRLEKIPGGRDLAIVVLPKGLLTKNLRKIVTKTRGLLLISDEIDPKQADELSKLNKRGKLALLGSASFGVANPEIGMAAVISDKLGKGGIGIVCRERSVSNEVVSRASELGSDVSKMVCTGIGLGADVSDIVKHLVEDKKTSVICICVDEISESRKLIETIKNFSTAKPILILKGGKVGKIFRSAVTQARGILVDDIEEILLGAAAISKQPLLRGKRIAVLTNFDGQGRLALNYLEANGFVPAAPSGETSKKISKKIPAAKIGEYIDMGRHANSDDYKFAIEQIISNENVDGLIVVCVAGLDYLEPDEIRKVMEKSKNKEKPVVGVSLLEKLKGVDVAEMEIPTYRDTKSAAVALRISLARHEIKSAFEKASPE